MDSWNAAMPMSSGGAVKPIVSTPETIDCPAAFAGDVHDSTRWK